MDVIKDTPFASEAGKILHRRVMQGLNTLDIVAFNFDLTLKALEKCSNLKGKEEIIKRIEELFKKYPSRDFCQQDLESMGEGSYNNLLAIQGKTEPKWSVLQTDLKEKKERLDEYRIFCGGVKALFKDSPFSISEASPITTVNQAEAEIKRFKVDMEKELGTEPSKYLFYFFSKKSKLFVSLLKGKLGTVELKVAFFLFVCFLLNFLLILLLFLQNLTDFMAVSKSVYDFLIPIMTGGEVKIETILTLEKTMTSFEGKEKGNFDAEMNLA